MIIEWDGKKAKSNEMKHGVSFEEAQTCFEDEYAEVFPDELHSSDEYRELLIGMSFNLRTLVIVFTEKRIENGNEILRIISARKATKQESLYYWNRRKGLSA